MKHQIEYLTHNTNIQNCLQILESGQLKSTLQRINNKVYVGAMSMGRTKFNNTDYNDEFPGVFLNYITKYHFNKKNVNLNLFLVL